MTKKCTISATSGSTIYFTDFNNLFGGKELAWLQDGFICEDTDPSTPSVYAWKYPLFDNDYVDKWYCTNGLACTAKKTFNNIDFYLTVNYIKNPT